MTRDSAGWRRLRDAVKSAAKRVGEVTHVPRVVALDPDTFRATARLGRPFVAVGLVNRWPLATLTVATLKERFGSLRVRARLEDYVGTKAFTTKRTMADMSLVEYLDSAQSDSAGLPPYLGNQQLSELSSLCDWPPYFREYKVPRIWLGPAGTITPLHCDFTDNLFAQIWGRKRFILFPPHHDEFLYTRQANPVLFASGFDPETPDYEAFPMARQARQVECVVEPGDLLFIPSGWFHHVRALEFSLSANRWADDYPIALQRDPVVKFESTNPVKEQDPQIMDSESVDILNRVRSARELVRQTPEWEHLRRQIYACAIKISDHLAFDFREMLTDPRLAEIAGQLMWRLIKPFHPTVLIGPGYGATPLLFSVSMAALRDGEILNILMVRDKRKQHNMKKWVEGKRQPAGSRAVIIDDFMLAGSAVPLVEKALKADKHDVDIAGVVLFFDMWQPLGSRQLAVSRYPVVSLYSRHDIGLTRDSFDAQPPLMKGSYPDFIEKRLWWRFDLNKKSGYPQKCTPVIADGAVFVADDHCNVWRHDLEDGAIEWKYESLADPMKGIVQLMQYADGSLVFGCYDGTITKLDARDGSILWRVRQDSSIHATPALDVTNNRLFINTEQWNHGNPFGHLLALDWSTGRLVWQYRHRYWAPGSPVYSHDENVVVATCNDKSMVCVDASTGDLRWKVQTHGLVRGRPMTFGGRVFAATETGRLHCVDIADGEVSWTRRYGKGLMHIFLFTHAGCVYLFDGKWHLSAFDEASGELRWISRLRSQGCWCPVPYGNYLVALSREGHLAVLDPRSEHKVWEGTIGGAYRQPPAIANGYLAAASNNEGLKVFKVNASYAN